VCSDVRPRQGARRRHSKVDANVTFLHARAGRLQVRCWHFNWMPTASLLRLGVSRQICTCRCAGRLRRCATSGSFRHSAQDIQGRLRRCTTSGSFRHSAQDIQGCVCQASPRMAANASHSLYRVRLLRRHGLQSHNGRYYDRAQLCGRPILSRWLSGRLFTPALSALPEAVGAQSLRPQPTAAGCIPETEARALSRVHSVVAPTADSSRVHISRSRAPSQVKQDEPVRPKAVWVLCLLSLSCRNLARRAQ